MVERFLQYEDDLEIVGVWVVSLFEVGVFCFGFGCVVKVMFGLIVVLVFIGFLFLVVIGCVFVLELVFVIDESVVEMGVFVVLMDQVEVWNVGDIDGFMEGYWNSFQLCFVLEGFVCEGW